MPSGSKDDPLGIGVEEVGREVSYNEDYLITKFLGHDGRWYGLRFTTLWAERFASLIRHGVRSVTERRIDLHLVAAVEGIEAKNNISVSDTDVFLLPDASAYLLRVYDKIGEPTDLRMDLEVARVLYDMLGQALHPSGQDKSN